MSCHTIVALTFKLREQTNCSFPAVANLEGLETATDQQEPIEMFITQNVACTSNQQEEAGTENKRSEPPGVDERDVTAAQDQQSVPFPWSSFPWSSLYGGVPTIVERISLGSLRQSLRINVATLTDPRVILHWLWCAY